jgi:hypothetical protein
VRVGAFWCSRRQLRCGGSSIDSGSVAASVAGVFGASFSGVTLKPGVYWIGAVPQNAPTTQPVMRTIGSGWTPAMPVSAGTSLPSAGGVAMGWQTGGITGALPATFPAPGVTTFAARVLARVAYDEGFALDAGSRVFVGAVLRAESVIGGLHYGIAARRLA